MALALEIIEKNYEVWSGKVKRFKEKILSAIENIPATT